MNIPMSRGPRYLIARTVIALGAAAPGVLSLGKWYAADHVPACIHLLTWLAGVVRS
jgi:hypothetical protein